MKTLTAAISCLLLMSLLGGVQQLAGASSITKDLASAELINTVELSGIENISITTWYPFYENGTATSKLKLNPKEEYVLMLVKVKKT